MSPFPNNCSAPDESKIVRESILEETAKAIREVMSTSSLSGVVDKLFLDDMSVAQFKERYPGKVEIAKGAKELLHLLLER